MPDVPASAWPHWSMLQATSRKERISIIQLDYTFMHDPYVDPSHYNRPTPSSQQLRQQQGCALIEERLHSTSSSTTTSLVCQAWIHVQLVNTIAADLNLPTRVSPPYSHQFQAKVERFHRNLFDQLRSIRLQRTCDLNIEPHMLLQSHHGHFSTPH